MERQMKENKLDKPYNNSSVYITIIILLLIVIGGYLGVKYLRCRNITTTQPQIIEIPYQYTTSDFIREKSGIINDYHKFHMTVYNQEDKGGEFQVRLTITFRDGGTEIWNSPAQFIGGHQSATFWSIEYKNRYPHATAVVIAPTKQNIINKQVTERKCYF